MPPARLYTSLSLAGYTAERPEIQRAINFLVATQKADGSWADDLAIHAGRQARGSEIIDADHLRRQCLGHARSGAARAEKVVRWRSRVMSRCTTGPDGLAPAVSPLSCLLLPSRRADQIKPPGFTLDAESPAG